MGAGVRIGLTVLVVGELAAVRMLVLTVLLLKNARVAGGFGRSVSSMLEVSENHIWYVIWWFMTPLPVSRVEDEMACATRAIQHR